MTNAEREMHSSAMRLVDAMQKTLRHAHPLPKDLKESSQVDTVMRDLVPQQGDSWSTYLTTLEAEVQDCQAFSETDPHYAGLVEVLTSCSVGLRALGIQPSTSDTNGDTAA